MKPGLAVLPLEVWADIFVFPWITRQELAKIVDQFKNRNFAEKLQFRLHDMGKHNLRDITIEEVKEILLLFSRPSLLVSGVKYELPETEMPENIRGFKQFTIRYLDDQVLDFLSKIKSLLTNVILYIEAIELASHIPILLGHLLPMLGSIHRINCENNCMDLMERQFPGTLALAKELHVRYAKLTSIPVYMNWLNAPQQQHLVQREPKFLTASANFETIKAIVEAVRKQFMDAANPSTFVVFLDFDRRAEEHNRVYEFTIKNAATKEDLTVRNAYFLVEDESTNYYVEIVRNPSGATAKMQEWIEQNYDKKFNWYTYREQQVISIDGLPLTIGRITNNAGAVNQAEDKPMDDDKDQAGPSTSAKKMEK